MGIMFVVSQPPGCWSLIQNILHSTFTDSTEDTEGASKIIKEKI